MFQSDVNGESGRIFVKFDSNNQWKIPVGPHAVMKSNGAVVHRLH